MLSHSQRFYCLVAAAWCLSQTPTAALADPADALLQRGIDQYKMARFRQSIRVLQRAQRAAKTDEVRARAQLFLGLNHGVLRRGEKAGQAFTAALRLDPRLTLDAAEVKQSVLALFNRARAGLRGKLKITADRPALVTLDSARAGSTPFSGELEVGTHKLVLATADGQYRHQQEVVVYADKVQQVAATLAHQGGTLDVTSRPSGAQVRVDGVPVGQTPIKGHPLPAGPHKVTVTRTGHQPQQQPVTVKAGSTATLAVALEPTRASLPEPPGPVPAEHAAPRSGRFPVWTVVTAGTALAALGVGLGFGAAARSNWDEYSTTQDPTRYDELRDVVPTQAAVANACYAAAGALAVTSALIYLLWERKAPTTERAAWHITPAGVAVAF